jgi:hypothetical protein
VVEGEFGCSKSHSGTCLGAMEVRMLYVHRYFVVAQWDSNRAWIRLMSFRVGNLGSKRDIRSNDEAVAFVSLISSYPHIPCC